MLVEWKPYACRIWEMKNKTSKKTRHASTHLGRQELPKRFLVRWIWSNRIWVLRVNYGIWDIFPILSRWHLLICSASLEAHDSGSESGWNEPLLASARTGFGDEPLSASAPGLFLGKTAQAAALLLQPEVWSLSVTSSFAGGSASLCLVSEKSSGTESAFVSKSVDSLSSGRAASLVWTTGSGVSSTFYHFSDPGKLVSINYINYTKIKQV